MLRKTNMIAYPRGFAEQSGRGFNFVLGQQRSAFLDMPFLFTVFTFIAASSAFKQFGLLSASFAVVYAGGVVLAILKRALLARLGLSIWPVLVFPLICLLSTIWSDEANATLRHASQLTVTAALGILIGSVLDARRVFLAMLISMSLCVIASLANLWLHLVPPFKQDPYAGAPTHFVGIFSHKNSMGYVLCILAIAGLYFGLSRRRFLLAVGGALCVAPIVIAAGSSTSLIIYLMAIAMPFVYWSLTACRSLPLFLILSITMGSLILFATELLGVSLFTTALDMLGKDDTLTGRTALWEVAGRNIAESPLLGIGYQAFWKSAIHAADVELVHAIVQDSIANFHNAVLEVLVAVGALGLAGFVLFVGCALWTSLCELANDINPLSMVTFWLLMLITIRSFVEASLYFQHQLDFLLLAIFVTIQIRTRAACTKEVAACRKPPNVSHTGNHSLRSKQ